VTERVQGFYSERALLLTYLLIRLTFIFLVADSHSHHRSACQ